MEDTQIIALYLSRQEAAIGETAKKYGGYINQIAYIVQYSPLLPPVGVWAVSQSQCGRSQIGRASCRERV